MRNQHMDLVTNEDLQTLLNERGKPCISIYIPTERMGRETRQNAIRFKNMLSEAEKKLEQTSLAEADQKEFLDRARREFEEDTMFWDYQSEGLALFLTPDAMYYYRLPLAFEQLAILGDRLHLKPLMPLFSHDTRFYVLALSLDDVRLLQGTKHGISDVPLSEDIPTDLETAMRMDDPEAHLNLRTTSMPAGGASTGPTTSGTSPIPATYHGHAVGDEHKTDIRRFFQRVNSGIADMLDTEQTPLVLAGVEYITAIYREVNTYKYVVGPSIEGNPDDLSPGDLHQEAWAIIEPRMREEREEAAEEFKALAGQGSDQAVSDLERVVSAAHYGQIDTLFVALNERQWGVFEPETGSVELHEDARPDNNDLLDEAAIHTLSKGGTVYAVTRDAVPNGSAVAAVLRY